MPRRRPRPAAAPVLAVLALGMLAGCGTVSGAKPAGAGTLVPPRRRCQHAADRLWHHPHVGRGTGGDRDRARPGAVPGRAGGGTRLCAGARIGKVPGNGGGAPVKIRGWVCKGFATPEVLATGHASACRKGVAQILAVLKLSATATPSS